MTFRSTLVGGRGTVDHESCSINLFFNHNCCHSSIGFTDEEIDAISGIDYHYHCNFTCDRKNALSDAPDGTAKVLRRQVVKVNLGMITWILVPSGVPHTSLAVTMHSLAV